MLPVNYLNYEERLLYNGLLFCELRSQENIDIKLSKLEKYVTKGVSVNTRDANDYNNTPLHVAVKKGEPKIVEFLLLKGASPYTTNINNQTPLDLANSSENTNKIDIIKSIEAVISLPKQKLLKNTPELDINLKGHGEGVLTNQSRSGTSEISGQLYESKLLGLLLHKALNDQDIDEFYIGSNINGLGAFDDIVFRYHLKNKESPTIVFIQAKHKDDPTRNKLTINSVLTSRADFSLDQYFDSFLKIQHTIEQQKMNAMFKNVSISNCTFVIYTTAEESFHKKKAVTISGKETLLLTSSSEKTFLYDYDDRDVEMLLAKSLAKVFATNIAKKNVKYLLCDEFMAEYHVFLAQNIVDITCTENSEEYTACFRKTFLESKDDIFVIIKETMCKELKLQDEQSVYARTFNLPKYFGNAQVPLNDEEYVELWKVMSNIIEQTKKTILDNKIIIIVINSNTHESISKKDLKRIKNLVGETLILDDADSSLFKFNLAKSSSHKNKKIIEKLKKHNCCDIDIVRFNIEDTNFPQLSLKKNSNIRMNLTSFLDKLQFYTNQAKEQEVENILLSEINSLYSSETRNTNKLYQIRGHAIFLDYHDRVQKWWKNKENKQYLTKSCTFYLDAKKNILNSPLVNVYNYTYVTKIDNLVIGFNETGIKDLKIQAFMNCSDTLVLNIITKDVLLTSIKLKQYFNDKIYIFIDLDAMSRDVDSEIILSELSEMTIDVVVFILSDQSHSFFLEEKFDKIPHTMKVILVSNFNVCINIQCSSQVDEKNCLSDLDEPTKNKVTNQKHILLQGSKIQFASLVDNSMYKFIKGNVLHKIMKNDMIEVGEKPIKKTTEFYVSQRLCRCLVLKLNTQSRNEFHIIDDNTIADIENNKDILIISNDSLAFNKNCEKHSKKNVHWFKKNLLSDDIKWVNSCGSINTIIKWAERTNCDGNDSCLLEVKSLNHVNERVVLLCAGPGMGKSTLLAHLITQTEPNTCVIKLHLLDLTSEFIARQKCDDVSRLSWFILILYKSFSIYKTDFLKSIDLEMFNNITFVFDNQVFLKEEIISKIDEFTLFELQTFFKLYNDNKIILIFDGFDEICPDFKNDAIKLFKLLQRSKIKRMWISSRPMFSNVLERAVNTISFTLLGFSRYEETTYLEMCWKINEIQNEQISKIKAEIERFLHFLSCKLNSSSELTSTPLHLRIISETIKEYFLNFAFNNSPTEKQFDVLKGLNIVSLYELFINKKFDHIRFGEKKNVTIFNDPDMKKLKERERSLFIENHKILGAYTVLHKKMNHHNINKDDLQAVNILSAKDLKHVKKLLKEINLGEEKTGIIEMLVQNRPKFVHITYAEYFASEYICDKVRQKKYQNNLSVLKCLTDFVLVMENAGIRRFIDAKFETDQVLSNITSRSICDALLNQRYLNRSALYVAVKEGRDNIALFLLNNLNCCINTSNVDHFIEMLTKKNDAFCTFCAAYHFFKPKLLLHIIQIIESVDSNKLQNLFCCNDYPDNKFFNCFILYESVDSAHRLNIDIILKHTSPKVLIKLLLSLYKMPFHRYKRSILHIVSETNHNINFLEYVLSKLNQKQRMRVFCARDKNKAVAAHHAASYSNIEFFDLMANLLDKKQFKIICTLKCNNGMIPLRLWPVPFVNLNKFKLICEKCDIAIGFKEKEGWFLYDINNPDCVW